MKEHFAVGVLRIATEAMSASSNDRRVGFIDGQVQIIVWASRVGSNKRLEPRRARNKSRFVICNNEVSFPAHARRILSLGQRAQISFR